MNETPWQTLRYYIDTIEKASVEPFSTFVYLQDADLTCDELVEVIDKLEIIQKHCEDLADEAYQWKIIAVGRADRLKEYKDE